MAEPRTIGRYDILGELGSGGMGEVFLAADTRLGRKVALKVLPQAMASDPDRLRRFEAEARVVAALSHPGIVTLYSFEEDADVRFMTMELIDGETLRQVIKAGRPDVTEATALLAGIADALAAAHANGITHRDLKPANIMRTREGRIKILDFGIARLHEQSAQAVDPDASTGEVTAPGTVWGTADYMAPEQALGRPADPRSDIFSVGIIAYELVTGQHPFPASSSFDRRLAIIRDTAKPIGRLAPQLPSALARAIDRCLCRDPDHRFQTAADLVDALKGAPVTLDTPRTSCPQSVAVLSFSDLSEGRNQEDFCAGIADELIDELTRLEGLRVTSRSSTLRFKNQAEDVRRIGELLKVEAVLEGSLRTSGNRMRVAVQFTSAEDGYLLWSGKFDRVMDDVFAVQTDIAHRVATALDTQLREVRGAEA